MPMLLPWRERLTLRDWPRRQLSCGSEKLGVETEGTQSPLGKPGLRRGRQAEGRLLPAHALEILILVHTEVLKQNPVQRHAGFRKE